MGATFATLYSKKMWRFCEEECMVESAPILYYRGGGQCDMNGAVRAEAWV